MPEWLTALSGPLGGLVGALVAVGALVQGVVVPAYIYRDVKDQRDAASAALKAALETIDQLTDTNAAQAREIAELKARARGG